MICMGNSSTKSNMHLFFYLLGQYARTQTYTYSTVTHTHTIWIFSFLFSLFIVNMRRDTHKTLTQVAQERLLKNELPHRAMGRGHPHDVDIFFSFFPFFLHRDTKLSFRELKRGSQKMSYLSNDIHIDASLWIISHIKSNILLLCSSHTNQSMLRDATLQITLLLMLQFFPSIGSQVFQQHLLEIPKKCPSLSVVYSKVDVQTCN